MKTPDQIKNLVEAATWRLAQIQKKLSLGDIRRSPRWRSIVANYNELAEDLERLDSEIHAANHETGRFGV